MKRNVTVFFTVWAGIALNFAAAQCQITGRITDSLQQPLIGATVRLTAGAKTILVTVSDTAGHYHFETSAGTYRLEATMTGYGAVSYGPFTANAALEVPGMRLRLQARVLEAVTVTAKLPVVEEKIDRKIVNVAAMNAATGSNILELLQKLPGVTVDENGTISLKGKSGVLLMIDDKPTYLSAEALAGYLRSLSASALDKIELMDNPPAQYDAAGSAGAINIRLKKQTKPGLNGDVSASYRLADHASHFESLNLNYHQDKINLFANVGYNEQHTTRLLDLERDYTHSTFTQSSYFSPVSHNGNVLLGADYTLSPKTSIGITLSGNWSPVSDRNPVTSMISHPGGLSDSLITALNTTQSHFDRDALGLNFRHQFAADGQVLTASLDKLDFNTGTDQVFTNQTSVSGIPATAQTITDNLPVTIHIYAGKADYSQPLGKKGELAAGIKSSAVQTNNAANYFDLSDGASTPDNTLTNRFLYRENINAIYVSVKGHFERYELQAGLRAENTNNSGHQLGNAVQPDSSFSNHYTDLFPTLYMLRKLDSAGTSSLLLSYGRRINRPYYQDLNPFITLLDQFTEFSGNPFLKPSFASNYQLAWRYKGMLTLAANYNHAADIMNETITQQGGVFISRPGNIGDYKWYAFTVNLQLNPASWWSCNAYVELSRNHYRGVLPDATLNEQSNYIGGNCYNQFTLGGDWSAELSAAYYGPHANAQFTRIGTGQVNAGLRKKLWHGKGSLRLNVNDLLHSYTPAGAITDIPGATATYHNTNDSRWLGLGLSYSFGTAGKKRDRKSSADDEAGRVKN